MWFNIAVLCLLSGPAATVQIPAASAADEAAIRTVVRQYVDARELRDPAAIETLFTTDADQHTTTGEWRRGRAQLVSGALESSTRNPGTRRIEVASIRFIHPDVAIADGPYEIASGGEVRRMWTTIVLARETGGWRITAIRNMVPAGGPAPGAR